ncbi:MAG: YgiT-type zinc finger protein [Candidatus Omnitrophica bacterium]|nr:YgiT-type zinc finger protein [Candidatus Omnitrophota bacterium]MBU1785195.1 YgiT-type zinc finger protein [Candidatus Omnitrophota bacterium]
MRCDFCGGRLNRKKVSYTIFYEGHWIIVEHVPAKVCRQCGEKTFSPDTVELLQKTVWSKRQPDKKIETPVFNLAS